MIFLDYFSAMADEHNGLKMKLTPKAVVARPKYFSQNVHARTSLPKMTKALTIEVPDDDEIVDDILSAETDADGHRPAQVGRDIKLGFAHADLTQDIQMKPAQSTQTQGKDQR